MSFGLKVAVSHVEFNKYPCLPVEFKKRLCCHVDVRGPHPLKRQRALSISHLGEEVIGFVI